MKPVGLLVAFAGYTLAYFGYCSIKGPGVGLVDMLVPGRLDGLKFDGTKWIVAGGYAPVDPNYKGGTTNGPWSPTNQAEPLVKAP